MCCIIFDVKMNITPKARYMEVGNLTDTPSSMKYASVVSKYIARIDFLVSPLNYIDILAGDIHNE